ncbi:hypothetical protein [Chitinolyticbacter meiyuanensis]|uniref:hypothetical protein n=1 Tax=Chitinolyticbacter meiyuanensis TaxID=682798 RepID=UPI0011E5CBC3|nr:hypothetical protein [Chitinolyticbacter meiyuanensis]
MSSSVLRRQRLLELLPRIYTAQPADSAVGAVIAGMAGALSRLDTDLTRVLYDRWSPLAHGERLGELDSAVERLGHLLQVYRLPARLAMQRVTEDEFGLHLHFATSRHLDDALRDLLGVGWNPDDSEAHARGLALLGDLFPGLRFDHASLDETLHVTPLNDDPGPMDRLRALLVPEGGEAYRQRLQLTAPLLTGGITTPRALLALAIADLGAEPALAMRRQGDTLIAQAMPLGSRKRCPHCAGTGPEAPCTAPGGALFEAQLTDNPVLEQEHREPAPRLRRVFGVHNASLLADRPILRLTATQRPIAYPAIQSRSTGEITLFAGTLKPGETLHLYPDALGIDLPAYDSNGSAEHHRWLQQYPGGRAVVTAEGRPERDVSSDVFYLWGNRFDAVNSRFGGGAGEAMRCGVLDQAVRTPQLVSGDNALMLLTFAKPDSEFADADETSHLSVFAGPNDKDGTRFALIDGDLAHSEHSFLALLLQSLTQTDTAGEDDGDSAAKPPLALHLEWLARPPATFRLRVPKTPWVVDAELRGAVALMRQDIERARAAGVRALIDFPVPPYHETHDSEVSPLALALHQAHRETHEPAEGGLTLTAQQPLADVQTLDEGRFAFDLVLDATRFDWSRLP